jgi:hypothetical protein
VGIEQEIVGPTARLDIVVKRNPARLKSNPDSPVIQVLSQKRTY